MESTAYVELCNAVAGIIGVIRIVHSVLICETDVKIGKIVVGTITIHDNLKIFITGFSYRISANVGELHCVVYEGEVRIGHAHATVGINGYIYVRSHTTTIVERDVKTDGFTCIDDTVAIVLVAKILIMI